MGLSESGMFKCENDHTLCDDHMRDKVVTDENKRLFLINQLNKRTWLKPDDIKKFTDEINAYSEGELDEYNKRTYEGVSHVLCPLCNFEDVSNGDAVLYLLKKSELTSKQLAAKIGEEFKSYTAFNNFIRPPKTK